MTEKRFSYEEKYVTLDGGVFVIAQSTNDAELISKTFNQLLEENEKLKKENEHIETCFKMADSTYHILQKQYHNIEIALSKYRKENEQLKETINEVKTDEKQLSISLWIIRCS